MKKKLEAAPLAYWEESSYMIAIPKNYTDNILKEGLSLLRKSPEFKVKKTNFDISGSIMLTITYQKSDYEIGLYVGGVSVPDYYLNKNFLFTEDEIDALLNATKALTIFMKFNNNPKKDFHFQLKVATTLIPDLIGLLDESAERMLPAQWVKMAAASEVLPSARDMFSVQAVQGKKDSVWLHTHGLCRAGITELEILESDRLHYEQHYNLLSTYAMYLLDKKDPFVPEYNGAYIGRLINNYPVVVTCIPWTEGIYEYKHLHLGNEYDRIDGHNTKTSIIFLYTSEEDEKNHNVKKISLYDKLWGDNPLFFFSDEETNRMRDLAHERFSYVKASIKNKENVILLKIALPLEEKGKFEHIWFELMEIKGHKLKAKLTQEPYGIPDIHTGYIGTYTLDDLTDWIIYTPDMAISPSNAYLLERQEKYENNNSV